MGVTLVCKVSVQGERVKRACKGEEIAMGLGDSCALCCLWVVAKTPWGRVGWGEA